MGERDIEDALKRLDELTREEAWMAYAQSLKIIHNVDDKVCEINDKVNEVSESTSSIINPKP